jgi:hypothetical protein
MEDSFERDLAGIAQEGSGRRFERLGSTDPGHGKNSGPNFGTVKPFEGWKLRAS